ncbi:MAG: BMC domain-containing protein [Clostridiales bacterium]|nr:BMC domain-containing protein [Clostridiales bacterium]
MSERLMRIIQETVPGREITLAHIIANPKKILYRKLGLDPTVDYNNIAIGMLTMTPAEMAIIASDIASKNSDVDLSFVDRFSGTLIITGTISNVESALKNILNYSQHNLGFTICKITRT